MTLVIGQGGQKARVFFPQGAHQVTHFFRGMSGRSPLEPDWEVSCSRDAWQLGSGDHWGKPQSDAALTDPRCMMPGPFYYFGSPVMPRAFCFVNICLVLMGYYLKNFKTPAMPTAPPGWCTTQNY